MRNVLQIWDFEIFTPQERIFYQLPNDMKIISTCCRNPKLWRKKDTEAMRDHENYFSRKTAPKFRGHTLRDVRTEFNRQFFQLLQTSVEKFLWADDCLILHLSKNAKKRKSILTRILTIIWLWTPFTRKGLLEYIPHSAILGHVWVIPQSWDTICDGVLVTSVNLQHSLSLTWWGTFTALQMRMKSMCSLNREILACQFRSHSEG